MIIKLLAVAFGGSIGAVLRFLIYELIESKFHSDFPWAAIYCLKLFNTHFYLARICIT